MEFLNTASPTKKACEGRGLVLSEAFSPLIHVQLSQFHPSDIGIDSSELGRLTCSVILCAMGVHAWPKSLRIMASVANHLLRPAHVRISILLGVFKKSKLEP